MTNGGRRWPVESTDSRTPTGRYPRMVYAGCYLDATRIRRELCAFRPNYGWVYRCDLPNPGTNQTTAHAAKPNTNQTRRTKTHAARGSAGIETIPTIRTKSDWPISQLLHRASDVPTTAARQPSFYDRPDYARVGRSWRRTAAAIALRPPYGPCATGP